MSVNEQEAVRDDESVDDFSAHEDQDVGHKFRSSISSYGADYPVDGLVSRIDREDVFVPPFQRGFV